ncbi:MAG: response regulator [Desulfatitalea sp.]|nr:response regulator [Desulfatitalea sp.]MBI5895060.1 response regulator [Desulfobacterales bacterium]
MESLKALFVDDETEYLQTAIKRMKKRGMDVLGVSSGAEALDILAAQKMDVVVMDMRMPGMDGIQALREIKQHYPMIEVIMLTGHASMEAAIQGMELGAFDYLMKPIDIDELIYKIQDAFQKRQLQIKKIENIEKLRR